MKLSHRIAFLQKGPSAQPSPNNSMASIPRTSLLSHQAPDPLTAWVDCQWFKL